MKAQSIRDTIERQREFFRTGATRSLDFRIQALTRFRQTLTTHQNDIVEALRRDLGKPEVESFLSEISLVLEEVGVAIKQLRKWARPQRASTSILAFPSSARILSEPFGVSLIIGPWNYPVMLILAPLVSAIAAGNCAVLKPSELAPATSSLVAKIVAAAFEPALVTVVEGGVETSQALLSERFDFIFFTGGSEVGKVVMSAAAKQLTPVVLELGGKSPCIVDTDVDLDVAVRRILWGKFLNAGQTCVAPDYVLVHHTLKERFVSAAKATLLSFFGPDPQKSPDYARIINERHLSRLVPLLESGHVAVGGESDREQRYLAPTLLTDVSWDSPIMAEEIFGPILPVLTFDTLEEAISRINSRDKPLALYVFSRNKRTLDKVVNETSSGGVTLNDTVMHVGLTSLPFGGVGASGMGHYHGHWGFRTFSHRRSVLHRPFYLDLPIRYAPYLDKIKIFRNILLLKSLT